MMRSAMIVVLAICVASAALAAEKSVTVPLTLRVSDNIGLEVKIYNGAALVAGASNIDFGVLEENTAGTGLKSSSSWSVMLTPISNSGAYTLSQNINGPFVTDNNVQIDPLACEFQVDGGDWVDFGHNNEDIATGSDNAPVSVAFAIGRDENTAAVIPISQAAGFYSSSITYTLTTGA